MTFLEFPRAALKQVLIREGRGGRDQGGAGRGPHCSLGAGPSSPSRNIQSNIFEFFYRIKPVNKWTMLMKLSSLQKDDRT